MAVSSDYSEAYLDRIARMIRNEVPSRAMPATADTAPLFRIYAVLLEALGSAVTARDVHNAWVAWMLDQDPEHQSLVPFDALPAETAREDEAYVHAIHRVAAKLS